MPEPGEPGTPTRVEIGGVARAHGIRGEIVVHTHDEDSTVLASLDAIYLDGVRFALRGVRDTPKGWLVALEGVDTRDAADRLRGQVVEVERAELELEDGEVLLADLIGCAVVLATGEPWGTIAAIDVGPAHETLVIHDGELERMLPLVDQFVVGIDVVAKRVTVDPPDGLPTSPIVGRRPAP